MLMHSTYCSDSKLTNLLEDELGGNCRTRVLLCLKPYTDEPTLDVALQIANQISSITNFPISNDIFAQVSYKGNL